MGARGVCEEALPRRMSESEGDVGDEWREGGREGRTDAWMDGGSRRDGGKVWLFYIQNGEGCSIRPPLTSPTAQR